MILLKGFYCDRYYLSHFSSDVVLWWILFIVERESRRIITCIWPSTWVAFLIACGHQAFDQKCDPFLVSCWISPWILLAESCSILPNTRLLDVSVSFRFACPSRLLIAHNCFPVIIIVHLPKQLYHVGICLLLVADYLDFHICCIIPWHATYRFRSTQFVYFGIDP